MLGIHLEGPFISPERRGMIQPDCLCPPSPQVLDEILRTANGRLSMMTIAPELPDCPAVIRHLADSRVVASFGHSAATYEQTKEGFEAGISHVTHLFNTMHSIHHRSPGPLVAIFETEGITAQIIPDGVHLHPSIVKLAFNMLGAERIIPITDGMQAIGLPEGKYVYNGIEYESKSGTARYEDDTLIGTALGLSQLLDRFATFTNCPFPLREPRQIAWHRTDKRLHRPRQGRRPDSAEHRPLGPRNHRCRQYHLQRIARHAGSPA